MNFNIEIMCLLSFIGKLGLEVSRMEQGKKKYQIIEYCLDNKSLGDTTTPHYVFVMPLNI